MVDSKRWRWLGTGLSESPHGATHRKRRDDECHAGIPDPISIVRTESQLSSSPWSVPLLTQAHGADSPSIPGRSERLVKKSQLRDPRQRMVFAASAVFAGPVAIGTSGREVVRCARAPVLLPQALRAVRCPIEMVLCSFPGQVHFCGNRACGTPPQASVICFQKHRPSSSRMNVPEHPSCNRRCQRGAVPYPPASRRHNTYDGKNAGALLEA